MMLYTAFGFESLSKCWIFLIPKHKLNFYCMWWPKLQGLQRKTMLLSKILPLKIPSIPLSPQWRYSFAVIYRFIIAFGLGYLSMSTLSNLGISIFQSLLPKAEAIYLSAFISLIFMIIYVIVSFCIQSLIKLTLISTTLFTVLFLLNYFLNDGMA